MAENAKKNLLSGNHLTNFPYTRTGKGTVKRLAWPGSLTTSMRFIITSASRSPSPLHSVRSRFARSIKLLDINRRVGDRPTLADLCRAGVLAHAFIFLNFEQDDFGRG